MNELGENICGRSSAEKRWLNKNCIGCKRTESKNNSEEDANAQFRRFGRSNTDKSNKRPKLEFLGINNRPKIRFRSSKVSKNTSKPCVIAVVGGKATGHYYFYGLADMPVLFQEMLDRILRNKIPAWQDDMIIATRGSAEKYLKKIVEILEKLQNKGYRASFEKSKFFEKEVDWRGFRLNEEGIKPRISRTEAIAKIKPPKTLTKIRSFLGSIQYLMKNIPNLTAETAPLRSLLQKNTKWKWTEIENSAFENLKNEVIRMTPLKHFDADSECI